MIDKQYLEIIETFKQGYQPCVDYGDWRVAVLCYTPELAAENITYLECHQETDEVFVLLAGSCILLIGQGEEKIDCIEGIKMVPQKLYNIKRGAYHNHTLSPDAVILIIENRNTGEANSERIPLTDELQKQLQRQVASYWKTNPD